MAYNTNVRNVLLANAAHADLEALQPYYYEMGIQLCHSLDEDIALALAECLLKTIVQRIGGEFCCLTEWNQFSTIETFLGNVRIL